MSALVLDCEDGNAFSINPIATLACAISCLSTDPLRKFLEMIDPFCPARRAARLLRVADPIRFDGQPSPLDHQVCRRVRVRALSQLPGQELCCFCCERLAKALTMLKNVAGVLGVENGFEFQPWRALVIRTK